MFICIFLCYICEETHSIQTVRVLLACSWMRMVDLFGKKLFVGFCLIYRVMAKPHKFIQLFRHTITNPKIEFPYERRYL